MDAIGCNELWDVDDDVVSADGNVCLMFMCVCIHGGLRTRVHRMRTLRVLHAFRFIFKSYCSDLNKQHHQPPPQPSAVSITISTGSVSPKQLIISGNCSAEWNCGKTYFVAHLFDYNKRVGYKTKMLPTAR